MIYRMIIIAVIMSTIMVNNSGAAPVFQDNLDNPALISPLAKKSLINGIAWAGKRLVSVGWRGHILYSDDQGKTWLQATVPVSSDLLAVHFPSPQKGWAVGHDGVVLHSSDGGITWIKQLDGRAAALIMDNYYSKHVPKDLPGGEEATARFMKEVKGNVRDGADKPFLDVLFDNETNGFIVGAFNLIFYTIDGGKSWEPWFDRTQNESLLHMYKIQYVGQDLFIVGERGLILKLDRRTMSFRKVKTPYPGSFFGITGTDRFMIIFGLRGNAFRSNDKGASWHKIETGLLAGFIDATVMEDGRIVMVSQSGDLLESINEGVSFQIIKTEKRFPATGVEALDRNTLMLTGFGGLKVQKVK